MEKCPVCGTLLIANPAVEKSNVGSYYLLSIGVLVLFGVLETRDEAGLVIAGLIVSAVFLLIAVLRGFTIKTAAHFSCAKCGWDTRVQLWEPEVLPDGSKELDESQ